MDDPDFYLQADLLQRYRKLGLNVSFNQLSLDNTPASSTPLADETDIPET
jgi:hypothetical protein